MSFLPAVTAVAGLVGSGISGYGQMQQGRAEQSAQNYNAQVLEREASNARAVGARESEIIKQNAILNEARQRKQMAINTGRQIGAYSKSGVSTTTGSPLDFIADQIANQELEIQIGQWNARNDISATKYNAEMSASSKQSEANLRRQYGKSATANAKYSGIGTLLQGVTQYGSYLSKENFGKNTIG